MHASTQQGIPVKGILCLRLITQQSTHDVHLALLCAFLAIRPRRRPRLETEPGPCLCGITCICPNLLQPVQPGRPVQVQRVIMVVDQHVQTSASLGCMPIPATQPN